MLKTGASWRRWRSFMVLPKYLCSSTTILACRRRLCSGGRRKKGVFVMAWVPKLLYFFRLFIIFFVSLEGLHKYCGVYFK